MLTYRTIIQKDTDGSYHGFVPALPGCHTSGNTLEETRYNLREVMTTYLEIQIEEGWPILQDNSYETLESVELSPTTHA